MGNDLRILVSASLNVGKSIGDINAAISGLEKKVNKLKLKIEVPQNFGTYISSFIAAVNKMKAIADDQNKVVREITTEYQRLDGAIERVSESTLANGTIISKTKIKIDERAKSIKQETKAIDDQRKSLEDLLAENERYSKNVQTQTRRNSNGEVIGATHTLQDSQNNKLVVNTNADGLIDNYKQIEEYLKNEQQLAAEIKRIDAELIKNHNETYKINKAINDKELAEDKQYYLAQQENAKKNLEFQQAIADKQARISDLQRRLGSDSNVSQQLKEASDKLSKLEFSGNNKLVGIDGSYKTALKEVDTGLKNITASAKTATSHAISFGEAFKTAMQKFPVWMAATTAFYAPLRALQSGVQYVYNLDTALTDLKKTTNATSEEYAQFAKDAAKTASSIGALTLDVIKSTTEWTRLGYTMQQATQLAKQTTIYQNVGDIANAQDASTALIAAIKGFGIEVDSQGKNITHLVDVYNEVGNKFSISSAGIGEAAKRSASALSTAGNSMEQSIALITAANSSVQDPEKIGNAMKTLSLRLRGINEDGTKVDGLFPTLEKKFNSLGLSLMKNDKTFKSTYEIFQELSKVWGKLSDFQKSDILELVAGKEQANVAASLINNWKDAEDALTAGLNSFGSAARENETYINSLQGHVARFQNAVSTMWSNSISSSLLKGLVDIGTEIVKSLNNVGTIIALVTGLFLTFKSKAIAGFISGVGESIKTLLTFKTELTTTTVAADGTTVAVTNASRAMRIFQASLGVLGLVITAGSLLYSVFNGLNDVTKKSTDLIDRNNKAYDNQISNLSEVSSYYEENYKNISKDNTVKDQLFNMQNKLIDTFGSEAEGLDLVNGKYDEQISKIKELNKTALENNVKDGQIASDAIMSRRYSDPEMSAKINWLSFNKSNDYDVGGDVGLGNLNVEEYYKKLNDLYKGIQDKNAEVFKYSKLIPQSNEQWNNALAAVKQKLDEIQPIVDQLNSVEYKKRDLIKLNTSEQAKFNQEQQSMFDKINASLSALPIDKYEKSMVGVSSAIKDFDGKNLNDVLVKIKSIGSITPDVYAKISSSLRDGSSAIDSNTGANKLNAKSLEELAKQSSQADSELKDLNQILQDTANGKALDAKAVADLAMKYPDLLDKIQKTANGWTFEKDAIEDVRQAQIALLAEVKSAEALKTTELYKQLQTRLKYYGIEIDSITDLATAQAAISNIYNNASSQTGEEIQMGNIHVKAMTKEAQNTASAIHQLLDLKDSFNQKYTSLLSSPSYGTSTTKEKKSSSGPSLNDAIAETDLTKERVKAMNAEYDAREKNIQSLDRQIKTAEKLKDYEKTVDLTTKKIEQQRKAVEDLKNAQNQMSKAADTLRSQNSKYNTSTWFDSNGEASDKYKEFLNSFAKRSQAIHDDNKMSVKERNASIKQIDDEQKAVESLFNSLYAYKQGWSANADEIQKMLDGIDASQTSLDSMRLDNTNNWLDKLTKAYSELDNQINRSKIIQSMYVEGSKEYNRETEIQISLLEEKRSAVENDIASIEQKIASNSKLSASERLTADQIKSLTEDLKQRKATLLDVQKAEYDFSVQLAQNLVNVQNKIDQTVIDSYQSQIETLQKQWEAEAVSEERSKRLLEISELQQKVDIYRSGTLATISDEQAKQLGLEQAKADAIQAQNDILKQQQVLQNIQKEKNVRVFQDGQFQWIADPRKIQSETEKLTKLQEDYSKSMSKSLDTLLEDLQSKQEDYNKWELDQTRKNIIAQLQAKIDAKNNEIKVRNEKFEEEKTAWAAHGVDLDTILKSSLDTINTSYGEKWDNILSTLKSKLAEAQRLYASAIGLSSAVPSTSGATGTSSVSTTPSNSSAVNGILGQMAQNSQDWHTATTTAEKNALAQKNQQLSNQLKSQYNVDSSYDSKTGKWNVLQYHTGGIVGEDSSIPQWLANKFGVGQNEQLAKLLMGEMVVKNPVNMVQNFINGITGGMQVAWNALKSSSQPTVQGGNTYVFEHIEVKTNDAKQFMNNLKLYGKNQ